MKEITRRIKTLAVIFAISGTFILRSEAQPFLTNGLVAYFPFDGNANDASSNGNNGTLFGAATFGVDRFGNTNACLSLPGTQGTGSGVDVPSLDNMPYEPVTYSAWFLASNYPPFSSVIAVMNLVGREQSGDQSDGALCILSGYQSSLGYASTNTLTYYTGCCGYTTVLTPPTNVWCQVVLTIDGAGNANFYFNGTNVTGYGTDPAGQSVVDFRIGASASPTGDGYQYVWDGLIDDVRIYSRALSASEVQQLYEYETPCPVYFATATPEVVNGFVVGASITFGGCGFTNVPTVLIEGGGGQGATADAVVSNGIVVGITITDPGSGYTNTPSIFIGESPFITAQPQSIIVNAGDTNTFDVTVAGGNLNYQWSDGGTNILGATTSALTISNITQTNLGTYQVVITNVFGAVTSSLATLSMYPYIVSPFDGAITYWGQTNTFSIEAEGTGPLDYQWFDDGVAIDGATNSSLVLSSIQFTNAGLYSVTVTSPLGSVTNTPEQVVVEPAGVTLALFPGIIINGTVGYNYVIQRTGNLSDTNSWVTLTNFTLTQPTQIWWDTNLNASLPANAQQFYRVMPGQ